MTALGIITLCLGTVALVLVGISVILFFRGNYGLEFIGELYGDYPRFFTMVFTSIVVFALAGAFSFCDYTEIDGTWQVAVYEKADYALISAQSGFHPQGSGSMFSFVFSQTDTFVVYIQDEETQGVKRFAIPTKATTIYFTDETPRGERVNEAYSYEAKNHFGMRKKIILPVETIYNLFIPEGSLASYDFD